MTLKLQQQDSQPAQATPQENAPGTGVNQTNSNNADSQPVQLNGDNKSESNGQINSEPSSGGNATPTEQPKSDQPNLNAAPATQPPPQQTPVAQPLMNMPMQNQAPPAQMQTQFNTPPPFAGFGMPPPNYMYPPNPWSMPWQPMPQPMANDKSRIIDPQVNLYIIF